MNLINKYVSVAMECDVPNETESVTEVDTIEMDRIAQRIDQGIGELEEINDEYDREDQR